MTGVAASPVIAVYRIAAASPWARAALKPLQAMLRTLLPDQARPQRALSQRDRSYRVEAELPGGGHLELVFEGEVLTVALQPLCAGAEALPETVPASAEATSQPAG